MINVECYVYSRGSLSDALHKLLMMENFTYSPIIAFHPILNQSNATKNVICSFLQC